MPIDAQSADDFDVPPLKRRPKNLAPFKIIVPFEIGELYMSGVKSKTRPF